MFAVTAIPDERKGERLIVLHTLTGEKLSSVSRSSASPICRRSGGRAPTSFVPIEALPYLGTGKLDLRRLRELALAHARRRTE